MSLYLAERRIPAFWTYEFLNPRRLKPSMPGRQSLPRRKAPQTVHYAPLVTRQTPNGYGNSLKWMPIMLRHGQKAAQPTSQTVRCYAKPTTERKVIDNKASSFSIDYCIVLSFFVFFSSMSDTYFVHSFGSRFVSFGVGLKT